MKKSLNKNSIKIIRKKWFELRERPKKIYFKKGKNIIAKNFNLFLKKYKIDNVIKILQPDFKLIKKNTHRCTHFNIQSTTHKSGKNYLIIKILKPGYFDGKFYKPPILDNNNFILAKCLYVQNNIDFVNLKEKIFKHSLSNIKNVKALKLTIKRRYKKTLAHLSDIEKLSLGVAITDLKIIKRF